MLSIAWKRSKIFLSLAIVSQLIIGSAYTMQAPNQQLQKLSNYNFYAAAVLPVTHFTSKKTGKATKYVILGREAAGKDVGTYDDWGGSRDKGEKHPVETAAREFYEEGILKDTLGMDLKTTTAFIDPKSKANEVVIASERAVTYIVNFTSDDIVKFRKNFNAARNKQTSWKNKEKDRIATVRWDVFVAAIQGSKFNKGVTVNARLIDPATGKEDKNATTITLRPWLVKRLRPYVTNQQFQYGQNKKIRFY